MADDDLVTLEHPDLPDRTLEVPARDAWVHERSGWKPQRAKRTTSKAATAATPTPESQED